MNNKKWLLALLLLVFFMMPGKILASDSAFEAWENMKDLSVDVEEKINQVNGEVIFDLYEDDTIIELGKVNLQAFLIDDPFSFQILYNLKTPFKQEDSISFEVYGQEGFSYRYNTALGEWRVTPWKEGESTRSSFPASNRTTLPDLIDSQKRDDLRFFFDEYLELETSETDYIFKLKSPIDGQAFFYDLSHLIDLNQLIDDSVVNTQQQADELGIVMDDEYGLLMQELLNPASFTSFFDKDPQLTVSFDKFSGLIHQIHFTINLKTDDLTDQLTNQPQKDQMHSLRVKIDLAFDDNDQLHAIEIPAEALEKQSDQEETEDINN